MLSRRSTHCPAFLSLSSFSKPFLPVGRATTTVSGQRLVQSMAGRSKFQRSPEENSLFPSPPSHGFDSATKVFGSSPFVHRLSKDIAAPVIRFILKLCLFKLRLIAIPPPGKSCRARSVFSFFLSLFRSPPPLNSEEFLARPA